MRKPIIKNWIKYCSGTLAVSGLLLLGSCGSEEQDTDLVNEVEAVESEPVVLERENVANEDLTEELGEEIDTDADDLQTAGNETDPEYVADEETELEDENEIAGTDVEEYAPVPGVPNDDLAYTVENMDAHLEKHEDVNQRITQELTDYDQALEGSAEVYNSDGNDQIMDQGRENVANRSAEPLVIGVYEIDFIDDYEEATRQRIIDIVNAYNARRAEMAGQLDAATGAYVAPEVEPVPVNGYNEMMDEIEDDLRYPNNAAVAGIEGIVFVNAIIDETGNVVMANAVEDVVVPAQTKYDNTPLNPTSFNEMEIRDAIEEMKMAAIEAVKNTSGEWEPAQQNGQEVMAEVQIPVRFYLPESGAVGNDD
ncbi:energy transducer TonB [Nafulsella turpanensis]|uniref:energy transducer TonB n=1 Tax=Nafulsella turpanensis TaxID=1265690 RepID=UPI00034A4AD9|nr:energy transducer TonB [Nafulsella turpanensis]